MFAKRTHLWASSPILERYNRGVTEQTPTAARPPAEAQGDDGPTGTAGWLKHRLDPVRVGHPWIDRIARALERYHHERIDYWSMKVVARGLFMAVSVMLVFLYVFDMTTSLLPGVNEITIPTMVLPDERDLGAVVHSNYLQAQGAILDFVGLVTLVISALVTAKALRTGSAVILNPRLADHVHLLRPRNLITGAALAVVVLVSWLLILVTSIRTAAISTIIGSQLSPAAVTGTKALIILTAGVLITMAMFVPLRHLAPDRPVGLSLLASALFGAFVVGANFVLLYSYIAALFDPDTSGGVVLVLTLLAWVNMVVRALFLTQCWVAELPGKPATGTNPAGPGRAAERAGATEKAGPPTSA